METYYDKDHTGRGIFAPYHATKRFLGFDPYYKKYVEAKKEYYSILSKEIMTSSQELGKFFIWFLKIRFFH